MIKNLVSLSRLIASGQFKATFNAQGCQIEHVPDRRNIFHATLVESLYCLSVKTSDAVTYVTIAAQRGAGWSSDTTRLWHARLAHVHETMLLSLHKQDLYQYPMPDLAPLSFCEACAQGKSKQSAYARQSSYRAVTKLELVHTDLCGPISAQSFGGALYFIPFVDDFTRMCFVYFIRYKHQALATFLLFLEMAERQTGNKLRMLRTDGGGELTSNAFEEQCSQRGIVRQVTAPYSSSMNGVAEVRHQILQYQARTMLLQAGLPIGYWAEAINTANYTLNRLPTSALRGKTPYEAWTGRKPTLRHMHIFGSPAYVHIPENRRSSKFDARADKMVLVGYMDELHAYKLLHPQLHKAVYSRKNVIYSSRRCCP